MTVFVLIKQSLFSFKIQENTSITYDKVNRRIEHFTNLKSNTTNDEAEGLFVSDILCIFSFIHAAIIWLGTICRKVISSFHFVIQLGGYGIGGSYWPHVDYSGPGVKGPGERLATIVTILDAPKAGTCKLVQNRSF